MRFGVRRSRVLGAMWIVAGLALVAAAVVLWFDRRSMSWFELPLGIVAILVGTQLWSQHVELDRHGVAMVSRSDTRRVLWASIASVDVRDTWLRPALGIRRKGDGSRQVFQVTSGLSSGQRAQLFDALVGLSREHGFELQRDGTPVMTSDAALDGSVQGRELDDASAATAAKPDEAGGEVVDEATDGVGPAERDGKDVDGPADGEADGLATDGEADGRPTDGDGGDDDDESGREDEALDVTEEIPPG